MGWFGGSKPGLTDSTPPARQDRQKCWDSRDAYYKCLDDCRVLVPGEEGKKCLAELASYQKSCAKSWVDYFDQRRVLAERQKASLDMANAQAGEARGKAKSS